MLLQLLGSTLPLPSLVRRRRLAVPHPPPPSLVRRCLAVIRPLLARLDSRRRTLARLDSRRRTHAAGRQSSAHTPPAAIQIRRRRSALPRPAPPPPRAHPRPALPPPHTPAPGLPYLLLRAPPPPTCLLRRAPAPPPLPYLLRRELPLPVRRCCGRFLQLLPNIKFCFQQLLSTSAFSQLLFHSCSQLLLKSCSPNKQTLSLPFPINIGHDVLSPVRICSWVNGKYGVKFIFVK